MHKVVIMGEVLRSSFPDVRKKNGLQSSKAAKRHVEEGG